MYQPFWNSDTSYVASKLRQSSGRSMPSDKIDCPRRTLPSYVLSSPAYSTRTPKGTGPGNNMLLVTDAIRLTLELPFGSSASLLLVVRASKKSEKLRPPRAPPPY